MKKKLNSLLKQIQKQLTSENLNDAFCQIKQAIASLPDEEPVHPNQFVVPAEIKDDNSSLALFSDGACRGNPGPGAWGYMIQNSAGEMIAEASGMAENTTNNQMELTGALEALVYVDSSSKYSGSTKLFVYTDSQYLVNGMNSWVAGWKRRGWKKADNKTPENVEIWQQLDELKQKFSFVKFIWVKGHAGHPQNEYCDRLANQELDNNGF